MQHSKFAPSFLALLMMFGGALFLSGCGGNDGGGDAGTFISEDQLEKERQEEEAARAGYEPPAP